MENTTFPAVLVNLMNSINAEGLLRSWRLDSTLKSYSLTIEWKILSSSQGERDFRNSQVVCQTVSQESPVISKPENSRPKPAAVSADSSKDELQKCDENILGRDLKANDCTDFQRCFRSLKSDRSFEEDTAQRDRESTKAITTENEVKYETQMCVQGRSKPVANHNKTIACERNVTCKRGTFILSPEKVWSPSTSSSVELNLHVTIRLQKLCAVFQDKIIQGRKPFVHAGRLLLLVIYRSAIYYFTALIAFVSGSNWNATFSERLTVGMETRRGLARPGGNVSRKKVSRMSFWN